MSGEENLIPMNQRTKEEARELGRKGGIASGKARNEKKALSEAWAKWLITEFDVPFKQGEVITNKRLSGTAMIMQATQAIILAREANIVPLIREIRQATEGDTINIKDDMEENPFKGTSKEDLRKIIAKLKSGTVDEDGLLDDESSSGASTD